VSLKLYRIESRKILKICQRFSDQVEKASCDEAFLDVTAQVKMTYRINQTQDYHQYDKTWKDALFMGFDKVGEGSFLPTTEQDKKLFIANEICYQVRKAIFDELGYNASAGVSHNKTLAKISCSANKPNG